MGSSTLSYYPEIMRTSVSTSSFGALLKTWRKTRKRSQLDVALDAEISARHLSFVETGRSRPSREMVLLLADVLEIPLRERNALLGAAGFAPIYRKTDLDAPEMRAIKSSIEFMLEHHNPYPAIVFDQHWNLLHQNRAAAILLPMFVGDPASLVQRPLNVMRLLFDPRGMRPFIRNWDHLAGTMMQRLHREAQLAGPEDPINQLIAQLFDYGGVPESWRIPRLLEIPDVIASMDVERDDVRVVMFSAITTLGTPIDITAQDLRIETFFPADESSKKQMVELSTRSR